MDEKPYTLDVALGIDDRSLEQVAAAVAGSRALREAEGAVRGGVPPGYWGAVAAQVAARLRDVLEMPVGQLLAKAWSTYRPFLKYLDRGRYPPGEVSVVPLRDHTVHSRHRPYVELRVNDQPAGRVEFEVEVAVTLEGAVLAIQDGKFRELRVGNAKVEGALSLGGAEILRREAERALPGVLSFGEGIPIAPLPEEGTAAG